MEDVKGQLNDSPMTRKSLKRTTENKRTLREEDQERTLEKDLSKQQIDLSTEELEGFILNYLHTQARKPLTAKTTALIRAVANKTLEETPKCETYTEDNMRKLIDENLSQVRENIPEGKVLLKILFTVFLLKIHVNPFLICLEIENLEEPEWKYKVHGAAFQGHRVKMEDRAMFSPYVNHLFGLPPTSPNDIFYIGVYDGNRYQSKYEI
jgi:hypothetical protein